MVSPYMASKISQGERQSSCVEILCFSNSPLDTKEIVLVAQQKQLWWWLRQKHSQSWCPHSVGWQKIDLIYVEIAGNLPGRPQWFEVTAWLGMSEVVRFQLTLRAEFTWSDPRLANKWQSRFLSSREAEQWGLSPLSLPGSGRISASMPPRNACHSSLALSIQQPD